MFINKIIYFKIKYKLMFFNTIIVIANIFYFLKEKDVNIVHIIT